MDRKNGDTPDKDDGKQPCPYCKKRFKDVNKHKYRCRQKPQDRTDCTTEDRVPTLHVNQDYKLESSFNFVVHLESNKDRKNGDTPDKDDGKQPCPYCKKRFKHVNKHKYRCPQKPQDMPNLGDQMKPCPYCHNKFKCLGMHLPFCTLKSQDERHYENAATGFSSVDDKDDDDQKTFQDLNMHLSKCKLNPQDKDCEIAATELSLFDDDDENVASQSSFREEEVSTLNENQQSKLKKQTEAGKCFKNFQKKFQLKKKDNQNKKMNDDLMENVVKKLNGCRPLKWKSLNSGSYYSYVKMSKPNEFDYLLCSTLVKCRIEQVSSSPNYCRVFVTNRKQLPLDFCELLTSDDELSPSKFKEYVFKMFDLFLKEMNDIKLDKISTGSTCPAYRVKYEFESPIPLIFNIDWIPCLEVEDKPDFCMEWKTKKLTDEEKMDTKILVIPNNLATNGENLELWRLNYSTFEKKIIREKCKPDDRIVIRILKNIVADENDHNSKIGSYHITNHCLHMFEKIGQRPELREYTVQAIDSFISRLQSRDLPNFFISSINLLQNVDEKECLKMIEKMKKYREQWTDK